MDATSSTSSATSTSYHNLSLAQAVLTLSLDSVLAWLSAAITSSSSSSSSEDRSRRHEAPASRAASAPQSPQTPSLPAEKAAAAAVDLDVVLAVMGASSSSSSVGFDEAAALFEEEEATVDEARAAFAVFDRDGDDFIDAAELAAVLRPLGFACGDAECRRMIDAYDEDADGRVGFSEFVSLMERTQQQ